MRRLQTLGLLGGIGAFVLSACSVGDPIEDDGSNGCEKVDVGTTVVVQNCGGESIDAEGVEVTVTVPDGAQSFALVVDGAGGELVLAERISSETATYFDFEMDISINRTDPTDGLYTVLVPTAPEVPVEAGDWVVKLRSGENAFDATINQVFKIAPGSTTLDVNLWFNGLTGLDAASAEADMGFQAILANVAAIYASAGVTINFATYMDGDAGFAITPEADLPNLFRQAPSASAIELNMFLVEDLGVATLLGQAGGVPGPTVLQGTSRSGVAVAAGSWLAALQGGDQMMIDEAAAQLEIIIAHETGHYLGLYHTVERNGLALMAMSGPSINGQDPLGDTPLCDDTADLDMDGRLHPDECMGAGAENLMFWSPANTSRSLTGNQGSIMVANPLIY